MKPSRILFCFANIKKLIQRCPSSPQVMLHSTHIHLTDILEQMEMATLPMFKFSIDWRIVEGCILNLETTLGRMNTTCQIYHRAYFWLCSMNINLTVLFLSSKKLSVITLNPGVQYVRHSANVYELRLLLYYSTVNYFLTYSQDSTPRTAITDISADVFLRQLHMIREYSPLSMLSLVGHVAYWENYNEWDLRIQDQL